MRSLELARLLDAADDLEPAAKAYEEAIRLEDADLPAYLDLAILYFVCSDFGYASSHRLSSDFETSTWNGIFSTLDRAEERFGTCGEIAFWRRYCRWILLSEDWMSESDIRELTSNGESLVPYFYLVGSFAKLGSTDRQQYQSRAKLLYDQVKDGKTARSRYILRVLESTRRESDQSSDVNPC